MKLDNPWKVAKKGDNKSKKPEEAKNKQASTTAAAATNSSNTTASNIGTFLNVVADLLTYFASTQKSIEKSNARIVEKYPKFLSKLALFTLQMDDSIFRETFMV